MKSHELREKRGRILEETRQLLMGAEEGHRALNPEEEAKFRSLHAEAGRLIGQAEMLEQQEEAERQQVEADERRRRATTPRGRNLQQVREEQTATYDKWLRFGMHGLDYEERKVMAGQTAALDAQAQAELRVLGTDYSGTPYGGYTIPEDFQKEIESALLLFGGPREAARIVPTSTGADLPWPTDDDTGQTGELLAEGSQAATQDVVFGRVVFGAYTYSSKVVLVQMQLLQDTAFDLQGFLREKFGERIGRITTTHYTTGTGSDQPNGMITAATNSAVTPSAAAGVTRANLIDIMHTVDRAYRQGGCRWMFHDTTLATIMKLALGSGDDRPLYKASTREGEPDTIEGFPFTVNNSMADDSSDTNKAFLFGAMKKYIIRVVRPMIVLRMEERYADYLQVGFLAFSREDGDLVDAGTNPVKFAQMIA